MGKEEEEEEGYGLQSNSGALSQTLYPNSGQNFYFNPIAYKQ